MVKDDDRQRRCGHWLLLGIRAAPVANVKMTIAVPADALVHREAVSGPVR